MKPPLQKATRQSWWILYQRPAPLLANFLPIFETVRERVIDPQW